MISQFQKRGYNKLLIEQQIDQANLQEREQLLKKKRKKLPQIFLYRSNTIEHSLKYKEIVMKHWHLLHINPNLAEIFQSPPYFSLPPKQKPQRHYWHQIN